MVSNRNGHHRKAWYLTYYLRGFLFVVVKSHCSLIAVTGKQLFKDVDKRIQLNIILTRHSSEFKF